MVLENQYQEKQLSDNIGELFFVFVLVFVLVFVR